MSGSAARGAALEVVSRVRERDAYAHETLDSVLKSRRLDERDAAFATRLAYGTIACRGTVDAAVARFLSTDVRLEPRVADALAIGAYEILFSGTAHHAAVSETVELVRSVRRQAAGLANAVMRRLSESAGDFPWGDPATDRSALARRWGHPEWLTELWVEELGYPAASALMEADNEPAPLFLALLPHLGDHDDVVDQLSKLGAEPTACPIPACLSAGNPAVARRAPSVSNRRALVMDAAAQLVVRTALQTRPSTVVEIGAGRGSKSLLAASIMLAGKTPDARLVAIDDHSYKLESLARDADRLGLEAVVETAVADATRDLAHLGLSDDFADAVLVDAPCSGLGTLRRHPDRRWRARPEEIEQLAALGTAMLSRAARLVKPGGFVVYSTCTVARRENHEVVQGFLASEQGREFATGVLSEVPPEWAHFIGTEGWFQSLPSSGGPDGHFIARLVRAG